MKQLAIEPQHSGTMSVARPTVEQVRATHSPESVARTALASIAATAISWAASSLSIVFIPRLLGPTDFGLISTALAIQGVVMTFGAVGTGAYLLKSAAREPARAAAFFLQVAGLRTMAALLLIAIAVPLSAAVVSWPASILILAIVVATSLPALIGEAALAGLQANQMMGQAAIARAFVMGASQWVIVGLLWLGYGIFAYSVAQAVAMAVVATITVALFWRHFGARSRVTFADIRATFRSSRSYMSADVALLVYGRIDMVILAAVAGSTSVGLYAFAYRLVALSMFLPGMLSGATMPALSASAHRDEEHFRRLLSGAVRLALLGGVPAAGGLLALAPELTRLVAGNEFRDAAPVLMLLAAHIPFVAIDTILSTGVIALDRQRTWARMAWAAAVLNPLMNLALIPVAIQLWANAAIGASIATLLTELMMTSAALYLMRSYLARDMARSAFLACVSTAFMMGVVLLVLSAVGVIPAIAVGVVSYGAAAYVLRLLTHDDVQFAVRAIRRSR